MPRAGDLSGRSICDSNPVPTKTNPLGVKGAGEAGNVGRAGRRSAMPSSMPSPPLGIRHIENAGHPRAHLACASLARAVLSEEVGRRAE